jgi:RNA ligase (TIGR02306 family)
MYLRKTDEERVQNLNRLGDMIKGVPLYYTEKLDGQSVTIFFNRLEKSGWWTKGVFGVCSRNIPYWERTNNNWWNAAVQSELHRLLPDYCRNRERSLAIQGEIVGPGIQGNKYVLGAQKLFVFNIWDIEAQRYVSYAEKGTICAELNLSMVPTCGFLPTDAFITGEPREFFLELAKDYSSLNPSILREGIVVRGLHSENLSFKAINNDFLLRYDHG